MVIAAEYTTATLVAWVLIGLALGFIIGWLLRPWLVRDRLREDYEEQLAERRRQLVRTEAELADVTAGLAEASTDREAARAAVVRLEAELVAATARTDDLQRSVATQALENDAEIERLTADAGRVPALQARIAELESSSADLAAARSDVARLESELEGATNRAHEMERAVVARTVENDAEIERLTAASNELSVLQARVAELETANADLEGTLQTERSRLQAELAHERAAAATLLTRVESLEAAVGEAAAEPVAPLVERVVEENWVVRAAVEAEEAATVDAAALDVVAMQDEPAPAPDRDTATLKVAEIAARTRGEGPQVDDDLRRIRGIGPKISRMLRDMGITSFRQIARFEPDDIAYVAAALDAFPDRIERDDWMSSATRLHEDKYGEPV